MTDGLGLKSWATGAMVLAALSACAGTATNTGPSTSPPASITSPSAPTSSAPRTPREQAATNAEAILKRYFAVIDRISQHPKSGLGALSTVTISTELTAEQDFLAGEHARGERQIGTTRIAASKIQAVNLVGDHPKVGRVPTVTIDACWDVSHADVVNKRGRSIVSPTRATTGWTRYLLANYHYATNPDDGWRVASARDLKQAPCAAS